jgi:thiamine-monophosphate kinase
MKDRETGKKNVRSESPVRIRSEAELLRYLRRPLDRGRDPKIVALENGHDAAVLRGFTRSGLAFTVDRIVEGVHFRFGWSDARSIAAKVFASNVSDLLAVGAKPAAGLLSLTFSRGPLETAFVRALGNAFASEARHYRMRIVGGNVTRALGPFTADLVAIGTVAGLPFRRDALRPGMALLVVGEHGRAAAGLAALERYGAPAAVPRCLRPFVRSQLFPRVTVNVVDALRAARAPVAAMDTSDGLGVTVATMASMSRCRVDLDEAALIPPRPLLAAALALDADASAWFLAGGEDYGLVVGVTARDEATVRRALGARRIPHRVLGRVCRGSGVRGWPKRFVVSGWDPFRGG